MSAPFLAPDRDERAAFGRAKAGATTYYSIPGVVLTGGGGSRNLTLNQDYYGPFRTASPIVVDRLAFEVVTAAGASNARIGLYAANRDCQPIGAPLADSGDISTATTGVKTFTPGTPIYLARGRYLTVINESTTGVAVRTLTGDRLDGSAILDTITGSPIILATVVGRTYAAFPTPGTAWTTIVNSAVGHEHFVVLRVLAP